MKAFEKLVLPSTLVLKNRIFKAAMEENMATAEQEPGIAIFNLYKAWSAGGAAAIITGNVMVDPLAMTGPAGISLHANSNLTPFKKWAELGKQNDTKIIMQINHPGRQTYKNMGGKVLSPSDVALDLGKHSSLFSQPKAMDKCDIEDVILRFTNTATLAEKAGFDGVQVHGAHGYLLSQFLSPLVNKRDDEWGGDLTNRSRLLLEIVKSIKAATSSSFSVSVKLNSADFQRGGFDVDDAKSVVTSLEKLQIDFVELSGGSYEAPAMQGRTADSRTLAREAYFLEFADAIAKQTELTVMTTGGIKKRDVAEKVLQSSVDIVGIASAMAYQPDLPNQWQQNQCNEGFIPQVNWKNKTFAALARMALVRRQLQRMGKNKKPSKGHSALFSLIKDQVRLARLTKRYRRFVLGEQS